MTAFHTVQHQRHRLGIDEALPRGLSALHSIKFFLPLQNAGLCYFVVAEKHPALGRRVTVK
ncbi:hypothetical protein M1D48_09580 [Erwinia sp. D4-22]